MGDQDRAVGLELGSRGGHDDVIDGDARELGQPGVGDMEGEERRYGWDDGMSEGFSDG